MREREEEGGGSYKILAASGSPALRCPERTGEKAPFHCVGKSERERWRFAARERMRERELRFAARDRAEKRAGHREERAAPGGCECHRDIGSARWLRMLRPVAANATDRLHKKLEICCCDNIFFVDMCPKTSTEPVG